MSTSDDSKDEPEEIHYLESPSLQDIKDAAQNIASKAIKTPLVRLNQRPQVGYQKDTNVR